MGMARKRKKLSGSWYFLIAALVVYLLLFVVRQDLFCQCLAFFCTTVVRILPVFLVVFFLMSLANYYITPAFVLRHLKEKRIKKWIFVVIGGIVSTGPIYMWYPLLADLRTKGLSHGLIACFLYNRAIKIPLLPVAVFYFGWPFVAVLSLVMIVASVLQGAFINKLMEE